ncbi:unnamed protein product [Lactuca virosa]|uniref:Uncharacterized protein n=1 Tax=Lactuca virosa TaxID=75947 RepID=A0AAU9P1E6_9ASTR|nr:unnamed protein product [Lactuca virosa]
MTNIFAKPRPLPITTTATQKPPTKPKASSYDSTNRPSKGFKSSAQFGRSPYFKLLEAKIDLILDHLTKPNLTMTPTPKLTPSITFEDLEKALHKNVTQSFLKVFYKLEELKKGFVNEVGPSFTKEGEETHSSSSKKDDDNKFPKDVIIQELSNYDGNASMKSPTSPKFPSKIPSSPPKSPRSPPKIPSPSPMSPPKNPTPLKTPVTYPKS